MNMTTDVDTFKKLYFQEFGTNLTDEEAERQASQLKRVYVAVYGSPVNQTNHEQINN
jgi:hypothetical protein